MEEKEQKEEKVICEKKIGSYTLQKLKGGYITISFQGAEIKITPIIAGLYFVLDQIMTADRSDPEVKQALKINEDSVPAILTYVLHSFNNPKSYAIILDAINKVCDVLLEESKKTLNDIDHVADAEYMANEMVAETIKDNFKNIEDEKPI